MLILILALASGFQDRPGPTPEVSVAGAAAVQGGSISNPRWARQPGWPALDRAFDRFPQGGEVSLKCTVGAEGRLENCAPVSETAPASGQAALRLVPGFQLAMEDEGVSIVGRKIQFSIRWDAAQSQGF